MTVVIDITVPGVPQQQGSKNQFGGESNAKSLKPWRASVADKAREAFTYSSALIREPVILYVLFRYPRPKGHYRTGKNAHVLRDDAPAFKDTAPDLDKLLRAVGDALTGVVISDDKLIVRVDASKVYAEFAGADITVRTLGWVDPVEVRLSGHGTELDRDVADDVGPVVADVLADPCGDPRPIPAQLFPFSWANYERVAMPRAVAPGRP